MYLLAVGRAGQWPRFGKRLSGSVRRFLLVHVFKKPPFGLHHVKGGVGKGGRWYAHPHNVSQRGKTSGAGILVSRRRYCSLTVGIEISVPRVSNTSERCHWRRLKVARSQWISIEHRKQCLQESVSWGKYCPPPLSIPIKKLPAKKIRVKRLWGLDFTKVLLVNRSLSPDKPLEVFWSPFTHGMTSDGSLALEVFKSRILLLLQLPQTLNESF